MYVCFVTRELVDLTELNDALKAGDDISTIKGMCVGKIIPPEAMAELWKVSLMLYEALMLQHTVQLVHFVPNTFVNMLHTW